MNKVEIDERVLEIFKEALKVDPRFIEASLHEVDKGTHEETIISFWFNPPKGLKIRHKKYFMPKLPPNTKIISFGGVESEKMWEFLND